MKIICSIAGLLVMIVVNTTIDSNIIDNRRQNHDIEFMKCVAVRQGKNKQYTKMTRHDTVFKGLIKCENCGCSLTPDIKKGKYIYLKPNSKKGCNCKQINENVANDMVSKVFKSMSMPEEVLQVYLEALRNHFKQSEDIQAKEKLGFTKDLTVLNSRLERLKTAYLDGDFTRDEYLTEKQNICQFEKKEHSF